MSFPVEVAGALIALVFSKGNSPPWQGFSESIVKGVKANGFPKQNMRVDRSGASAVDNQLDLYQK